MLLSEIACAVCDVVSPTPHTQACEKLQAEIDARNAVRVHAIRVDGPVWANLACGAHLAPCACPA